MAKSSERYLICEVESSFFFFLFFVKAQCHYCPKCCNVCRFPVAPSQTRCQDISPVPSTCHSLPSWMPLERSWEPKACPTCSERQGWIWRNRCGLPVGPVSQRVMLSWLLTCSGTPGCVFMTAPGLNGLKGHRRSISSQRERERRCE